MDSERKLWLCLWLIGAAVIIAIVGGVIIYNHKELQTIQRMVESGVDPVVASCAIDSHGASKAALCAARVAAAR